MRQAEPGRVVDRVDMQTFSYGSDPTLGTLRPRRNRFAGRALSPRQREVLSLLASGVTARGIAAQLGLSEATVRNHIRAILAKLDCHSQLEAVAVALRTRIISPSGDPPARPAPGPDDPPPR